MQADPQQDGRAGSTMGGERIPESAPVDLLQIVFDVVPAGIAVLRAPEFVYELVNPAYAALISNRPCVGHPLVEVLPDLAADVLPLLRGVVDSGKPFRAENMRFEMERDTPGVREETYFSFSYLPLPPDARGRPGVLATVVETTEQVKARRRAEESEERARARAAELEAVMDAVPALVQIAHDPGARKITGSRASYEMLRSPQGANVSKSGEAPPRHFRVMRDGRELTAEELPIQVAAGTGRPVRNSEIDVVFDDGSTTHLLGNAAPLFDAGGKVRGAVGAFVDITARVEADRQKDEFLAMLSHELRNPLAPILNGVAILERIGAPGGQAARATAIIERQARHMARLVDDLLDVTRISRGKLQLRCARMDLADAVRRTVEDHWSVFAARAVAVELRCPEEPIWVDGDATRIAQMVGNLLHNAEKFTDPGGRVVVSAERSPSAALVRVRDDGVGIPPDLLGSLFSPFRQADHTLERSRGGLGLGLALVKGIAELHGGTVQAHSAGPGTGAEFAVSLPLASEGAARSEPPARQGFRRRRVLVIEDNVDAGETLRDLLELDGHEVRVETDALRSLETAARVRPDVVLCDIGLPGIDGYEIARRLRASPATRGATLVALTGYASPDDVERAAAAGFDHHLGKPPDLARLAAILAGEPLR